METKKLDKLNISVIDYLNIGRMVLFFVLGFIFGILVCFGCNCG